MTSNLSDDKVIQEFLQEVEDKKGVYDEDTLDTIQKLVTKELPEYLQEDDIAGIFMVVGTLRGAVDGLEQYAREKWTLNETAKLIKEALREEAAQLQEAK